MGNLLKQHGLPVLSARNTAVIEAVTTLPPVVVADLFGLHSSTAENGRNTRTNVAPCGPPHPLLRPVLVE
ncbi:uncharacterized protein SAZU_0571 [Streptomyces azureus]|uniref:Uncharacterized protein n=1 Tax=Streptomyces azureus TaxID=146537 RepID=A0A0K8PD71_STRAJ|nr:uncharacterized protein SAZU_0571 [Streptomyces azureus]